jgi:hypothetical protein
MGHNEMHLEDNEGDRAAELLRRFIEAVGADVPDDPVAGVTMVIHSEPVDGSPVRGHQVVQLCRPGFHHELLHDAVECIAGSLDDFHARHVDSHD